jgi:hypothetical protein
MRFQRQLIPVALACLALAACGPGGGTDTLSSDAGITTITLDSVALANGALTATIDYDVETVALELVLPAGASATIDGVAGTSASIEAPGFGAATSVAIVVTAEDGTKKDYSFVIEQDELGFPAAGEEPLMDSAPRFAWAAYKAAAGISFVYDISLWTSSDGEAKALSALGRSGTTCSYYTIVDGNGLLAETAYGWKVLVRDSVSSATLAQASGSFTTGAAPSDPANVKISRVVDGLQQTIAYYLSWDAVPGASEYDIYYDSGTSYFMSSDNVLIAHLITSETTGELVDFSQFRVVATNDFGDSLEAIIATSAASAITGVLVDDVE